MKSHDKITMSIAQAVEKVFENNSDFVDLHSIDANKRRGSEPLTEKDIDEANEFTKAAAKAAVAGDKDFEFDGKTYPTEMDVDVAKKILGESTDLEEGFFADFKKAFNTGKIEALYKDHEDAFIKMIEPHVKGRTTEVFFDFLKKGIKPEKQLERLKDEIEAAIKANGGLKNTIKKLGKNESVSVNEAIDFSKVNDDQLKGWLKVFKKHTGNPWSGFKDDVKRAEKEAKKRGLEESVDLEESLASKKIDKITNMLDSLEIALRPKGGLNKLVNLKLDGNYDNDFKIVFDYITAASAKWEDAVVYDQENQQI